MTLDAPLQEKEHISVPPRPVSVSDGGFTLNPQLLQTFPQLQHSQLLNITRHKEVYLELAGAPLHYGTDVRTGRDVLIYDIYLTCGGADITTVEFLNLLDQLCCYVSLTTPPQQIDTLRPYGPQIRAIATNTNLSTCVLDAHENSSPPTVTTKGTAEPCTTPKSDHHHHHHHLTNSSPVVASGMNLLTRLTNEAIDFVHPSLNHTGTTKDTVNDHDTVEGFSYVKDKKIFTYIQQRTAEEPQKNIQIKLFPKFFSKYFFKVLQAYINSRDKKLVVVTEHFQGLFLPSLFIKIKTNSQGTRRLHDSLVHKYCCNLIDSLLYVSQHKISLKGLDPRCIVVDTQQCILRLFPSAFLISVTRADEMIYRHPSELYISFLTGLGLSPRDFFWYKSYIGQALAYWLSKYNEFLNLEKNSRLSNPSVDHRQRDCRDSQSISHENINGLFYHIYSENLDDMEEYPSYFSLSTGFRSTGDGPIDTQGPGVLQGISGPVMPASSPSSGKLAWTGSNETITYTDTARGSTTLDQGTLASVASGQGDHVHRGASIPNFLVADKLPLGPTSITSLDINTRTKQPGSGPAHTCTTSFNCPCILYLFMKRLLVLSTIYMPLFLKHLTATIKDQFEVDFAYQPRHSVSSPRDTRLFKLLTDFVGFPIDNPLFQENEKAEYAYIISPHCSKCCKVLRGMIARFRSTTELAIASLDCGSQGYASYSKIPSSQQYRMERSASGNIPSAPVSHPCFSFPPEDMGGDATGSQCVKAKLSEKYLTKHRLSKRTDKLELATVMGSDVDGQVGSSAVTNAKSPQDCEYDQELVPFSHAHLSVFTKGSPEAKFISSAGKSKEKPVPKDSGEVRDQILPASDHQHGYDTGRAVLDLCVSSPNVSQELSESLEADVVQGHTDDMDEFRLFDFGVIKPVALRNVYSLGLVMLCIATGADPWTQEEYLIDNLLNNKLPTSLMDVQNKDLCELITKCIDGSNCFGSIEAVLEHKYFKEHLEVLQHQQQKDATSHQDHLAHANLPEREIFPAKAKNNPFKMVYGNVREDEMQPINSSVTALMADPIHASSERSSTGRFSVTDSALHTEGSATDCLSEQDGSEPKHTFTKQASADGQLSRGNAGLSLDSVKGSDVCVSKDGTMTPLGPPPHYQVTSSLTMNTVPSYTQVVTPNSMQSSTPTNTNEHTCTDDSMPLSQQASESKLPCASLEPTTVSSAPVYPRYKRVELLTLRGDTATLAVIYLTNGNVEKKITHSITNDEDPSNIYTEMIKKMESEQLVLKQTEALKDDIEDLLKKKFYHSTD
ncbi:Hypothetical protein GLP15_1207 [Giardia lamblia P15]|uniref:Protein kinase domain-containing protein n=1 Tax=Giardia intestinalis (strain P15) TaxID=658858 RepID=E1EZV3_GIAIA|nr:Hypothetical protein GLP15_1207 [Giardia lamblia P15]